MHYGYKVIRFNMYKNLGNPYHKLYSLKCIKNNKLSVSFPLYSKLGGTLYISMYVFLSEVVILEFIFIPIILPFLKTLPKIPWVNFPQIQFIRCRKVIFINLKSFFNKKR